MLIPDNVKSLFNKNELVAFGTANNNSVPNVVPIFWKKVLDKGRYHKDGPSHEQGKSFIQLKKPDNVPKGVVKLKVTAIYTIKPGSDAGKKT